MIPPGPVFHKPKSFITAKNILYAGICVAVLDMAMRCFTQGIVNNGGIPALLMTAAIYLVMILLIKQMSLCRLWARTVLTGLLILVIISAVVVLMKGYVMDIVESTVAGLQVALNILALIFLYRNECNLWFNSSSDQINPPLQ